MNYDDVLQYLDQLTDYVQTSLTIEQKVQQIALVQKVEKIEVEEDEHEKYVEQMGGAFSWNEREIKKEIVETTPDFDWNYRIDEETLVGGEKCTDIVFKIYQCYDQMILSLNIIFKRTELSNFLLYIIV